MIKSCPLCGSEAETKVVPENSQTVDFLIRCKSCKCEVRRYLDYGKSNFDLARQIMIEVEEIWNNRK